MPIYEGTNGIQAIDLVTRKLPLGNGNVMKAYLAELSQTVQEVAAANHPEFGAMAQRLDDAVNALTEASLWTGGQLKANPQRALAGATPYLRLFGITAGGCYLAKGALASLRAGDQSGRVAIARFFAEHVATAAPSLALTVTTGSGVILDFDPKALKE